MIIWIIKLVFSVWMLIDASNRRASYYWFFIIMMPGGALIYFFVIKVWDYSLFREIGKGFFKETKSLKHYEYEAKNCPSLNNKMLLGQALYDHKKYERAKEVFEEILKGTSDNKQLLFCLGICLAKLKQRKEAIESLEKVVENDLFYKNYEAAFTLVELYWEEGQKEKAIERLRFLCKRSQQIKHRVVLADYLIREGKGKEAEDMLNKIMEDHRNSPRYERKREKKEISYAKQLLRKW